MPIDLTEFFKNCAEQPGMVNKYRCKLGHETTTLVGAPGVTPMNISCKVCGEFASSTFYREGSVRGDIINAVWLPYLPKGRKMDPDTKEHLQKGGLLLHYL